MIEFQKSDWFLNISNDGLNFWAASLIRNLASICVEFQYLVDTKVVGFVVIFQLALVSFRLDKRFRRYHYNSAAAWFDNLCAENCLSVFDQVRS